MTKSPRTRSRQILIVGCGRLGSHLAGRFSERGDRVVVVDRNRESFGALAPNLFSGFRVEGDASEPSVLRQAGIDAADVLIAATADDNLNIMVALVGQRIFHVRRVMARVYDPRREAVYEGIGLSTVCPTKMAAELFQDLVEDAPIPADGSSA